MLPHVMPLAPTDALTTQTLASHYKATSLLWLINLFWHIIITQNSWFYLFILCVLQPTGLGKLYNLYLSYIHWTKKPFILCISGCSHSLKSGPPTGVSVSADLSVWVFRVLDCSLLLVNFTFSLIRVVQSYVV